MDYLSPLLYIPYIIIGIQIMQTVIYLSILAIILCLIKRFFRGTFYLGEKRNLEGHTAIITGGGGGIGKQLARHMAKQGCSVIIADIIDANPTANQINLSVKKNLVSYKYIDLGNLETIKQFVDNLKESKVDFLINNAGVMGMPKLTMTHSKFQAHYGINYIGHFYLTNLLWPKLNNSNYFKVINVSSITHRRERGFGRQTTFQYGKFNFQNIEYNSDAAYARSKLYLAMFSKALNQIIPANKGIALSVHPGIVRTNITQHMFSGKKALFLKILYPLHWLVTKNCEEGVQTFLYLINSDSKQLKGGQFYMECKSSWLNPVVDQQYKKMFQLTCQQLGVQFSV